MAVRSVAVLSPVLRALAALAGLAGLAILAVPSRRAPARGIIDACG
ncbi:hypothetical protein ABH920_007143 [Catenulispora sp. EB89]